MTNINEIRCFLGLSWKDLSDRTGYAESTLKNVAYGSKKPSKRLVKAVEGLRG